jgi:peroxiredoxin
LQAVLGDIEALGAKLVAITPQLPEHNRTLRSKHALAFHMLTDKDNAYAAALGLRNELPERLRNEYMAMKIDLPAYNDEPSWSLPIPARFVVDKGGIIRAADVDVDYRYRPEPSKTLDDLRKLG